MRRKNKPNNRNNHRNQPDSPGSGDLTPKQSFFVKEYLIDLNGTQAAIRAGYSKKTASAIAVENLTKPLIQAAIQKAQAKRSERIEITQDQVLREYAKLAFHQPKKFYDDTGGLIPIHLLPDDVAAALTGMDVNELFDGSGENRKWTGHVKRIKYSDKKGALDSVAKHLGMFIERHEHSGPKGGPIQTQAISVNLSQLNDKELEMVAMLIEKAKT